MSTCVLVTVVVFSLASALPQSPSSGWRLSPTEEEKAPLPLSLKQAMEIALAPEGNARIQLAEALRRQAEARAHQARSALLPTVEATLGQQNLTRNLEALGIRFTLPLPGFRLPSRVGPFTVVDARATLSQSFFDVSSIERFQAARAGVTAAHAESESVRDQVAAQVARLYLAAVRADAEVKTAEANVALAEALLKLARDQKEAGTGTAIEVTRAQVQLANERQRLLAAQTQRRQAHLELLRAIGLDLTLTLDLTDPLAYVPVETLTVEQALAVALQARADLKAQQHRQESARRAYRAVALERLPSLVGYADYGSIGTSAAHLIPTRTYGVALRLPVFDGGRRDARRAESFAQFQQEQIRTTDLRQQIELEIRVALDSLRSADEQVKVAQEGVALAERELEQARRRYQAGVTTSLELTDAQTRLERARHNYLSALYAYNLARIALAQAMGTIRQLTR
ncbi:MAG TPA: TolC family protein [Blastocatellia bacterium]|nr:TolC family protein [Blastocatellia bacterium]